MKPFDAQAAKQMAFYLRRSDGLSNAGDILESAIIQIADLSRQLATVRAETIEQCAKVMDEVAELWHSGMEGADEPDFSECAARCEQARIGAAAIRALAAKEAK